MVLRETSMKNSEEKAAALHNVQNATCGSCGFCTTYLFFHTILVVMKIKKRKTSHPIVI
jgi:hypothetical protein